MVTEPQDELAVAVDELDIAVDAPEPQPDVELEAPAPSEFASLRDRISEDETLNAEVGDWLKEADHPAIEERLNAAIAKAQAEFYEHTLPSQQARIQMAQELTANQGRAAEEYKRMRGVLDKMRADGFADMDQLTEALGNLPAIQSVGQTMQQMAALQGTWTGVQNMIHAASIKVQKPELWAKYSASLPQYQNVAGGADRLVDDFIGDVMKMGEEAGYKRGLTDAKKVGGERAKGESRSGKGPDNTLGSAKADSRTDDQILMDPNSTIEQLQAVLKKRGL